MSRPTEFLTFSTRFSPSSSSSSRSPLPPPRTSLLLTDTLEAPAQFALSHYVQRALRPSHGCGTAGGGGGGGGGAKEGGRKVVLVGVSEREEYWSGLMRKNGIQLATETVTQRFSFIDASAPSILLPELYASLVALLRPSPSASASNPGEAERPGPLVIIDDLAALVWRGEGARETVKWWRAVRAAVDATNSSLITLLHADSLSPSTPPSTSSTSPFPGSSDFADPEDQYVFRQVLLRCEVWVEVTGLMTGGGAGGTRGEITVHRGPALLDDDGITLDPTPPLQYKLEDSGAVYEVKGLGRFL